MIRTCYKILLLCLMCWGCDKQKQEVTTFSDGKPRVIWTYEKDTLNGIKKIFWENGNPRAVLHYSNGQLQGGFTEYYKSGLTARRGEFLNGKLHGRHYKYSESDSGKVLEEEYIMNPHGKYYYFYKKTFDTKGNIIGHLRFLIIEIDKDQQSAVFKYVDTAQYDSMKIIAGNFTEKFDLPENERPDTLKFVNNIVVLPLKKFPMDAEEYLRGRFIGFNSRIHGDTVTVKTWIQYYEQKVKDLQEINTEILIK